MWIRIVRDTEIALDPKKPDKKSRLESGLEIEVMPRVGALLLARQEGIELPGGPGLIVRPTPAEVRGAARSKARAKAE
jgi:hypothetical protein